VPAVPEGHAIHRFARLHRRRLAGRRFAVTSPQGRFADGAARLTGLRLDGVDAAGKHLFYRWQGGATLHVHLGLYGKFRVFDGAAPAPSPNTRLAMSDHEVTLYLAGPADCSLIDPEEEESIRSRLGPDPLADGADGAAGFAARLSRRTIPIGAALLDQKVVAGIGNVYRAELLFLEGIDPRQPANTIGDDAARRLWERTVAEMRRGERAGRIVTVDPAEVGARSRRDLDGDERLYVYHREDLPCRRCGETVVRSESAGRWIWSCPGCQPPVKRRR
jgi:formamidopyrimidine-DNA glycosylase